MRNSRKKMKKEKINKNIRKMMKKSSLNRMTRFEFVCIFTCGFSISHMKLVLFSLLRLECVNKYVLRRLFF